MTSIRSKMPLVTIIILACMVIFFTVWNIIYEKQMLQRILILYGILTIFVSIVIFSWTVDKTGAVSSFGRKFGVSLYSKLHYFRCPNCNGIFTIKESESNDDRSPVITCPHCRTIGRIQSIKY